MSDGVAVGDAVPKRNLSRQAAIAQGGAVDHRGHVAMIADPDFDIDHTIFKGLKGIARFKQRRQLSMVPHWAEVAVQRILKESATIPASPPIDRRIPEFMQTECDFSMEHADGSFLDHLTFCHDYSAVHYSAQSPRVMLLHSILGVGTNIFPMEASKIPKLASLLSPDEMKHVECFPSVLRLMFAQSFIDELWQRGESIDRLRSVEFRRVIDNKELVLEADELWAQLNYHLVHLVDFVPVADWTGGCAAPLFQTFVKLYRLLSRAGQLRAKVDMHTAAGGKLTADEVEACARACESGLWHKFCRRKARKLVMNFSKEVGHSLEFQINWNE